MSSSILNNTDRSTSSAMDRGRNVAFARLHDIVILICWLLLCGGLMFWRTFHVAYGFDDIVHLHALACLRTGEMTFWTYFFHQHNEHIVNVLSIDPLL